MSCGERDRQAWQDFGIPMPCDRDDGPEPLDERGKQPKDGGGQAKKRSQADRLVELASERYTFHQTPEGDAFALPLAGPRIARMLRGSRSMRAELAQVYASEEGKVPSSQALADALLVVEGRCRMAPTLPAHLRVAPTDREGLVGLDLGREDGASVVVGDNGWVVAEPPEVFRRTRLTGVLPIPDPAGDLDELRRLMNVDDESWSLVIGWLVACLHPGIPAPILLLEGEQGSAKSWAARLLVRLIDASAAETRSEPKELTDWTVAASGSWVVAVDNVSRVPPWWSDALCRAVTGDGLVRRALYTDAELSVIAFRRRVILTGIDVGGMRGDLADRLLRVELERIPEGERREEEELEAAFRDAHPRILGGLLDLAASVFRVLPDVTLARRPRMADFGRVLAALDRTAETDAFGAYLERARTVVADVLDADPVGGALRTYLEEVGSWEGTAGELLEQITPERPPKGWPKTPQAMGSALRRLAPSLRAAGVEVEQLTRTKRGRPWRLQRVEGKSRHQRHQEHYQGKRGDEGGDMLLVGEEDRHPDRHRVSAGRDANDDGDDQIPLLSSAECCEDGPLEARCQLCPSSPSYYRRAEA